MRGVTELLDRARGGDERAFAELVEPHRRELAAHCYRMLGSMDDADEAVQETLLAAWRALDGFQQRSSLRTWLYTIATRASLRMAERRPPRVLSFDHRPAARPLDELEPPDESASWLGPWIGTDDDPAEVSTRRESIELAYVAALQHLPPNQRAVLILRDVLDFSAAETAELLDTSPASVNSALQRARAGLADRAPSRDRQREQLEAEQRGAVDAFVAAFEAGDVPALVALLADDVRFTMPPLPAWFDGVDDVAAFLQHRVFATPWRIERRIRLNGGPGLVGAQFRDGDWRPGALLMLQFAGGRIDWIATFVDPGNFLRLDR
jgi:RNA polymerase sigma-70 factor (ECF subfamily)